MILSLIIYYDKTKIMIGVCYLRKKCKLVISRRVTKSQCRDQDAKN